MKTPRVVCRSALATGIAGAFFLSLMAGSASALCGYAMTEHPLHQHFTAAGPSTGEAAPSDWEEKTKHPLRGDFPYAAANPPAEEPKESDWQERTKHPLRGHFPRAAATPQAK